MHAHCFPLSCASCQLLLSYGSDGCPGGTKNVEFCVQAMADQSIAKGAKNEEAWSAVWEEYKGKYAEEAAEFKSIMTGEFPANWADALPSFTPEDPGIATRQHSQTMLNAVAPEIPGFMGGSADLAGSNLTLMKMFGDFQKDQYAERNMRFGVREHGMGAICNGVDCSSWYLLLPVFACGLSV